MLYRTIHYIFIVFILQSWFFLYMVFEPFETVKIIKFSTLGVIFGSKLNLVGTLNCHLF